MKIGVVSDTHGHVDRTGLAVQTFERLGIDLVLHCGDIGSAEVIHQFNGWPTHFVFGNVDDPDELRPVIQRAGQTCQERFGSLELEGKRVGLLHSDDERLFNQIIRSGQYDLICFGHTHTAEVYDEGPTKLLNPGALYRTARPSVALVELPALRVVHVSV